MCDHQDKKIICNRDRTERKINTVICFDCGLVFIDPIPSKRWYANYYTNDYRREMADNKCIAELDCSPERMFKQARRYAENVLDLDYKGKTVVEVGSSSGGILSFFKDRGFEVLGIEPNKGESDYSNSIGIKTINKLFEDIQEIDKVDNILCIQSLNHLIEPHTFLIWAKNHLNDDGMLTLSVANWEKYIKNIGYLPKTIQIDHPFMFTSRTLRGLLADCGFTVIDENNDTSHIVLQAVVGKTRYWINISDEISMIENNKKTYSYWFLKYGYKKMLKRIKLVIKNVLS